VVQQAAALAVLVVAVVALWRSRSWLRRVRVCVCACVCVRECVCVFGISGKFKKTFEKKENICKWFIACENDVQYVERVRIKKFIR
jgi:hypothetical protein